MCMVPFPYSSRFSPLFPSSMDDHQILCDGFIGYPSTIINVPELFQGFHQNTIFFSIIVAMHYPISFLDFLTTN